jgi:ribose 5-phosphate isomerase A
VPDESPIDTEKRVAAEAAAELVEDGTKVGLGTGSTVAFLLPALGIDVGSSASVDRLDIAIDGTDQVTPDGWLIKGGGGAHFREKIVAAAADRFIVIGDSSKPVDQLSAPVPLELAKFGLAATMREIGEVELRDVLESPDGGLIADYRGPVGDPAELSAWLASIPGVVGHGLFPPKLVSEVLIGRGESAERLELARG